MAGVEEDLYEVLNVSKTATKEEITKAYRKAALTCHPDKVTGTDAELSAYDLRFKSITNAYEILTNDRDRERYDLGGFRPGASPFGTTGMGGMEPDLEEILNMFGGMPGQGPFGFQSAHQTHARQQQQQRSSAPQSKAQRGEDEALSHKITLEEAYGGKTTHFSATKRVACTHCRSTGAKERAKKQTCSKCKGDGAVRAPIPGLGGAVFARQTCPDCAGSGSGYRAKDRCSRCAGKCSVETKKLLELFVPRGSATGDRIFLRGEADHDPRVAEEPGDLVFKIEVADHERFTRKGHDLCAEIQVPLVEALTGLDRVVLTHLDGRGIKVKVPRGQILVPGAVLRLAGEGMPIKKSDSRGDLYLSVLVKFPGNSWVADPAITARLIEALPKPSKCEDPQVVDERDITITTLDDFGGEEQWEDAEDEDAEPQAGCNMQ